MSEQRPEIRVSVTNGAESDDQDRIADRNATELKQLAQEPVAQSGAAVLGDPDEGLRVRDDFGEELQRSLAEIEAGERTTSLADVAERLESAR